MKMLKTGDKCPCCGQPIVTEDERLLLILSAMNDIMISSEGNDADDHG